MSTRQKPKPLTEAQRREAARRWPPIVEGQPYDCDERDTDAVIRGMSLDGVATEAVRKTRMRGAQEGELIAKPFVFGPAKQPWHGRDQGFSTEITTRWQR